MDQKVILCEHRWSPWFLGPKDVDWRSCSRCHGIHHQNEPEPRIIIARIEDA